MAQWLRLQTANARGPGSIPGQGTRSLYHNLDPVQPNKQKNIYFFNPLYFTYLSLLAPKPLATTDFCTGSVVLLFPECHIVETIQYIAFSDWFLSLSSVH